MNCLSIDDFRIVKLSQDLGMHPALVSAKVAVWQEKNAVSQISENKKTPIEGLNERLDSYGNTKLILPSDFYEGKRPEGRLNAFKSIISSVKDNFQILADVNWDEWSFLSEKDKQRLEALRPKVKEFSKLNLNDISSAERRTVAVEKRYAQISNEVINEFVDIISKHVQEQLGKNISSSKKLITNFKNNDINTFPKAEDLIGKTNTNYTWSRYSDNSYEVSSQGDSRFSALSAKLKDGRTIEEAYQLDVKGYRQQGNDWRLGKGKAPIRKISKEESWQEYKALWKQYLQENPELLKDLQEKAKGKVLTDKFASTDVSQARALAELLNELSGKIIIKQGIDFVFEQNSELAKIGSKEQYSQYLDTIFPDSKVEEMDNSLYISVLNQLEQENKIEKDCIGGGKLKAEKGLVTSFTKGGKWKVIKDLKGYPTHEKGGVDLTINKDGVSIKNGNTQFTAKYGLVIPKN